MLTLRAIFHGIKKGLETALSFLKGVFRMKQDRHGARTFNDLARRYKIKQSFAKAMGLAEDANQTAQAAGNAVNRLDQTLDSEEVFNRLTNNGEYQGFYRDDDGNMYINASYVKSGVFESEGMAYLIPVEADMQKILDAITNNTCPDGYDLDGDGILTLADYLLAHNVLVGKAKMEDCAGAVKSKVTVKIDFKDPQKTLHIYGTNQWGSLVEVYLGIDSVYYATRAYVHSLIREDESGYLFRYSLDGTKKEYFNPPMEAGVEYRTIEKYNGWPVYTKLMPTSEAMPDAVVRKGEALTLQGDANIGGEEHIQVWYAKVGEA